MNPLAILLAALSMFLIGGLWYAPVLFGRLWMRAGGFDAEAIAATSPARRFGLPALLALVMATVLAGFVPPDAGVGGAR